MKRVFKKVSKEQMKKENWTREMKLDYYCNINDEITIATQNRKLGSQVCGLSMPNKITCDPSVPCFKTCYCSKGNQAYANIYGTYLKNLRLYHEDPEFFDKITAYLRYSGYKYMRFFDSGDCPDLDFFKGIIKVCNENKKVKFLMYTKKYYIINNFIEQGGEIPKNLKIFFSAWDKEWNDTIPNPYGFSMAYVQFKDDNMKVDIPEDAFCCQDGTGCCSTCYKCWNTKKDVYFKQH